MRNNRIYRIETAGPLLLDALKAMVSAYPIATDGAQTEAHSRAAEAIAKAMGEVE